MSRKPNSKGKSSKACSTDSRMKSGNSRSNVSYKGDYDTKRDEDYVDKRDFNKGKRANDPRWYAVDEALLRDSASIPFSWATGTLTSLTGKADLAHLLNVPGIQVIEVVPSIGKASNPSDPINIAAFSVYSWVRHANSGSANYDAPDLMLYLLAMSQVYSSIVWLERIYAEAYLYSQRNRYMPRGLMFAEGVDADDIMMNLAAFRYGINVLINKAASFSVPNDMTMFTRQAFLYQNIYIEGTSMKDQMYMYVPGGFWQYDGAGAQGGVLNMVATGVASISNSSTKWTHTRLLQFVESLLAPIMASEDMNIMSGDILKAYGQNGTIKLTSLDEVRTILPMFDIGVLEQMKNAIIAPVGYASLGVSQDPVTNVLRSTPTIRWAAATGVDQTDDPFFNAVQAYSNLLVLTTTTEDTNPGLVMESTRMMIGSDIDVTQAGTVWELPVYTGTEVAVGVFYITMSNGSPQLFNNGVYQTNIPINVGTSSTGAGMISFLNLLYVISNFDFHPRIRPFIFGGSGSSMSMTVSPYDIFDVDNYAVLTAEDLRRLHETALMSEFHVPTVSKV